MKLTVILWLAIGLAAQAQEISILDIEPQCKELAQADNLECYHCQNNRSQQNKDHQLQFEHLSEEGSLSTPLVIDESDLNILCEHFEQKKEEGILLSGLSFELQKEQPKKKFKVIITFGPFLAFHHKMNLKIKNEDTNAVIKGIKPKQRHGLHHYNIFGDTRVGQFIDEPQNRITVELINDKMFMGLEYSHPKILFQDQWATPDNNQNVSISGTLAGEEIDVSGVPLKDYIYQIQASHGNTNLNAFAGKVFKLAGKKEGNNFELHLGGGAGTSIANGVTKYFYIDDNGQRKLNITENEGIKPYGFNVNGKVRIKHNFLKGRMNASLNYDGVYTRIDGQLGGFQTQGHLFSHQVGISVGVRIDDLFKKKKRKKK